jgi:hypothetical protein
MSRGPLLLPKDACCAELFERSRCDPSRPLYLRTPAAHVLAGSAERSLVVPKLLLNPQDQFTIWRGHGYHLCRVSAASLVRSRVTVGFVPLKSRNFTQCGLVVVV